MADLAGDPGHADIRARLFGKALAASLYGEDEAWPLRDGELVGMAEPELVMAPNSRPLRPARTRIIRRSRRRIPPRR